MNREDYKRVFSHVSPSEETIERILNMAEKKQKRFKLKAVLLAAAVVILMLCTLIAADAATGGDVFKLEVNGEQVGVVDYVVKTYTGTDENGNEFVYEAVEIPSTNQNIILDVNSAKIEYVGESTGDIVVGVKSALQEDVTAE